MKKKIEEKIQIMLGILLLSMFIEIIAKIWFDEFPFLKSLLTSFVLIVFLMIALKANEYE